MTGAAFGIVWGLVRGNTAGWDSAEVLIALTAGVALVAGFVAWERRAPAPMLPLDFFKNRSFSAGNAAMFCLFASLFGAVFVMAQFFQTALGHGPLATGVRLLPWTGTVMIVSPIAGKLGERFGDRPFMIGGLLCEAVGLGWIALIADSGRRLREPRRAADRRRLGRGDGDPRLPERGRQCRPRGRDRQGERDDRHDARARRRLRDRRRRGGIRRQRQLREPERFADGFAPAIAAAPSPPAR